MKIIRDKSSWPLKFSLLLLFLLAFCVAFSQAVYAANEAPDKGVQQDLPNKDNMDQDRSAEKKEPKDVTPTTLTITLQDESGLPIRGITLSAIPADFTGKVKGRATTDQNGKAVFTNLKSGAYYFFANFNAIRRHPGYGLAAMIREFKTSATYYLSESRQFDLSENVESTFTVNRGAYVMIQTYLQVVRSGKIIVMNKKSGLQQIIPVASTDYLQIYLPMRNLYQIVTIKDNDYDSWILEIYAHERMRIELL